MLHLLAAPAIAAVVPTLPPSVVVAVLVAAGVHATWNAIAHGISDKLVAFTLVGAGGALGAVPLVLWSPLPQGQCWPFLAASVVLHVIYTVLLMHAYRLGDFSQVYPLARGTAPLVVTILAAVFISETPSRFQAVGVLAISAGLGSLVVAGHRHRRGGGAAISAAVATGLAIAAYTTVDGIGVRLSHTSLGYAGWLLLLEGSVIPLFAVARHRRALLEQIRPVWAIGLAGGVLSLLAYGLVLWAQTRGPLGPIAALRETSIIFGALIGALVFHERFGRPRLLATIVVACGILALTVSR